MFYKVPYSVFDLFAKYSFFHWSCCCCLNLISDQIKEIRQRPISIGMGGDIPLPLRSDITNGETNKVARATIPGIRSSAFSILTDVPMAANADKTKKVPQKSKSFDKTPPVMNINPKASSL